MNYVFKDMASRIKPVALYEEVAERLRERIYNGGFAPGEWLDEQALAEGFGISRTPLREALKVLCAEGLVVLKPRHGCYVTELSEQDLDEIFPVMALLEGRCAYEAVRKASPDDLRRLEKIHARLEEYAASGNIERYYEHNYTFHEAIQDLAGNPWLTRISNEMRRFLKLLRGRQLNLPGRLQESLEEHRMIMAAFQNHNPGAAEKVMHDHLMRQRDALAAYEAQGHARTPPGGAKSRTRSTGAQAR